MSLNKKNNVIYSRLQAICERATTALLLIILFFMATASAEKFLWKVNGLAINSAHNNVIVSVDGLHFNQIQLSNIKYVCPSSIEVFPVHHCDSAEVTFSYDDNNVAALLTSDFNFNNNNWSYNISSLSQDVTIQQHSEADELMFSFENFEISQLFNYIKQPLTDLTVKLTGDLSVNGFQISVNSQEPITFSGFNFEYSDEIIFAEISGQLDFSLDLEQQILHANVEVTSGEMLFKELYVDFKSYPIHMTHDVQINNKKEYEITSQLFNQQSLSAKSKMTVNDQFEYTFNDVSIEVFDAHYFNQKILNNVLGIYGFGGSEMSGRFLIDLALLNQQIEVGHVIFDDFYLLNQKRKLQFDALDGSVFWNNSDRSKDSFIEWDSLIFAGMPVAASAMNFNLSQDQFSLLGKHEFPVFDGFVVLNHLSFNSIFDDSTEMNMNAQVLPISLKLITEKLGWPVMSGTISGNIPDMVKEGNVIKFSGGLNLSVFDGLLMVENLSLERLFGVAPVIAADVAFEKFNLTMLTETFGFGKITGQLSGVINDLRITNWKTDRMDAQVYTVKSKEIKQTISQKAIDNISSLGGIKGAISKTFLRFFDDFKYEKIKLSCKLHNAVCQIGGMKNQNNKFVIVEGSGIPKINIVGFVRTIDWEVFISRLMNANYNN